MTDSIQDECAAEPMAVHDLAALEQRIEHRMRERDQLAAAFDALADQVRSALADGRSPLAQIGELDQLNHRIECLEGDLCSEPKQAEIIFSGLRSFKAPPLFESSPIPPNFEKSYGRTWIPPHPNRGKQ